MANICSPFFLTTLTSFHSGAMCLVWGEKSIDCPTFLIPRDTVMFWKSGQGFQDSYLIKSMREHLDSFPFPLSLLPETWMWGKRKTLNYQNVKLAAHILLTQHCRRVELLTMNIILQQIWLNCLPNHSLASLSMFLSLGEADNCRWESALCLKASLGEPAATTSRKNVERIKGAK